LRRWATDANPFYRDGLKPLAAQARAAMDAGLVPARDTGSNGWEEYPTEMYAQLFAFTSLIEGDPQLRASDAARARTLLMHVMNEAAKGAAAGVPFRDPGFASRASNRSRWYGEAFALTVDWIYPSLSAADKATIRKVFLRWADEIVRDGYQTPRPVGVVNDPVLISDPVRVRWAGNNFFTAHMRNLGLMAMALDPADDPDGALGRYLANATGAFLYMTDHLLRTDARGGLAPEGFQYSPQALGYVVQFLLALHTAGQDKPDRWGPQVVLSGNPFWNEVIPALLHSLSPAPTLIDDENWRWLGEVYQPAWYGDGQNYWAPDFIELMGPLGLYDHKTGNRQRAEAIRWIQTHTPPGGQAALLDRVGSPDPFRDTIPYFMLFDPAAPTAADPRPSLPLNLRVPGLNKLLARTAWSEDAAWFTYSLSWNTIDHQHGDGNTFEYYRRGEWLTKERTGYGVNIQASDYHNTLALENDPPIRNEPGGYRHILWRRGSQWVYVASGDPHLIAHSFGPGYVYALGDATNLYNSEYEASTGILHTSRSIVWLKPDHIVVYDRAASKTAGRFKRFWLNLPAPGDVSGNQTTITTARGQRLFITSLLPADAVIAVEPAEPLAEDNEPANGEPMRYRLKVEAPGGPAEVRFLHVLQGADPGAPADLPELIRSESGREYVGVRLRETVVLFPVKLEAAFDSLTYRVQAGVTRHLITGLTPAGTYDLLRESDGSVTVVTLRPGTALRADEGGVLVWSP
jgi:hypothetical protein